MTDAENKISLTPDALAALVDSRIAERDAKAQREAERIWQLQNPPPTPAKPINAPDELVAELTKALDANGGDADKATLQILGWLALDINHRPSYPDFYELFYRWEFMKDVLHPAGRAGAVKNLMINIKRQRERAKAGV